MNISPDTVKFLSGTWCRNVDHIMHLRLAVDWPDKSIEQETEGYRRLIFWDHDSEYLFPNGSYTYMHGAYIINGYFIARAGGTHQGVSSLSFERVDDAMVLLNPAVREIPTKRADCC